MYCSNCGNQITEEARFCSFCGTKVADAPAQNDIPSIDELIPEVKPVEEPEAPAPVAAPVEAPAEAQAAPIEASPELNLEQIEIEPAPTTTFDEFQWNVDEYPSRTVYEKTEDVDFDWNADPATIVTGGGITPETAAEIRVKADLMEEQAQAPEQSPTLGEFFTISKKNEEFQQLLNKEYEKVKANNTIGDEISAAEQLAEEKFESRPVDNSMEAFLEREGVEKLYEPKEFETDVLKKIEAQEKAKERKRLEEEAREKALEEARQEALRKKQQAEEARQAIAEAEAKRAQAEENARIKAEEAAKAAAAAQEAMKKAEAEAEAARLRAEEQAQAQAEAERLAAMEAAKIQQQKEARCAAEEEARAKAEEERRRYEEERLKSKLEAERQELTRKAETAAAAEEARKVLEHTTRMREEEAAKIKAAIAGLRGELDRTINPPVEDIPAEEPAPVIEETPVVETPALEVPAEDVVEVTSFEDLGFLEDEPAEETPLVSTQRMPEIKEAIEAYAAPVEEPAPVREDLSEMAKARDTYFATFYGEESLADQMKAEALKPAEPAPEPVAEIVAEEIVAEEITEPEPEKKDDLSGTRIIDKSAVLAGLETTRRISKAELRAQEDKEFFESLESVPSDEEPAAEAEVNEFEFMETADTVDDLIKQFTKEMTDEEINATLEGFVQKDEPAVAPDAEAAATERPGLTDTMIMPGKEIETSITQDFDNYGVEEAENFKKQQEMASEAEAAAVTTTETALVEVFEDDDDEYDEPKGGIGRLILKIILILLVVIFVAELAGIGIKFLAPDSGAAAIIDNQLEKIIHLITG